MVTTKKLWLIPVGFLIVTSIVYGQSLRNYFINLDDKPLIVENPIVRGLNPKHIGKAFVTYDPELYVPLTMLTYQAEYSIAGLNASVVHFDNLVLHTLSALLVAGIIFLLFDQVWIALFCGLLFAVHPQNAEAVLWASARKDLLSGFFCFASIATYLLSKQHPNRGRQWFVLSITFFLLGLLSKVSIALLPLTLLLIDWHQSGTVTKKTFNEKIPFTVLSMLFIIFAFFGKSVALAHTTVFEKVLMAPKTILFTLSQFFFPHHFSLLYPYTERISVMNSDIFLPIIALAFLLAITAISLRKTKAVAFSFGFFLIMLLPSLLNIERGIDVYFASDRYAYVPSLGLLIALAALFSFLNAKLGSGVRRLSAAAALVVVLVLGFQSHRRTLLWRNNVTLYTSVLSLYPNAYAAHSNLGLDALDREDPETAFREFRLAADIHPTSDMKINQAIVLNNLATHLMGEKKWQEAIEALSEAARLNPTVSDIYFNLGVCFEQIGKRKEAKSAFLEALRLNPDDTEAKTHLTRL